MRILHVIASMDAGQGGNVRAAGDLCTALTLLGDHCELATLDTRAGVRGPQSMAVNPLVPVHRFVPSAPRRLGNSLQLARWLLQHTRDFDLLEVHGIFRATSLLAATAARLANVPFIVHPHGSLDPFDLRKRRAAKRILGPLFKHILLRPARAVVFTSPTEMENANTFGARVRRYWLPLPIVDDHDPGNGDRLRFRKRIHAGAETFLVLFMSRIDYKKGLIRTLRALALVRARGIDVELIIAGSGDRAYEATVAAEVDRLHIGAFVHFVGFLDGLDKGDAFAAADAFVLVSDKENFGIVVVEALRAGVPVVISDRVAIAGDLSANGAAVVVAPEQIATADAIADLQRDRARALAIGAAGRRTAVTLFDWRRVTGPRQQMLRRRLLRADADAVRPAPSERR